MLVNLETAKAAVPTENRRQQIVISAYATSDMQVKVVLHALKVTLAILVHSVSME
jgi:hypothetical protein